MKTGMHALREDLKCYYPYIYGSILQVISDQFDWSAKSNFHTIFNGICLALKFISDGSGFRFHRDWITKEEQELVEACRICMINRMRNLFLIAPPKNRPNKRDFLDDLFSHFLQHDDMDTFFDIFKVSGEKYLELFHFKRIIKKCPRRVVAKALSYLPSDCSSKMVFLYSLRSPSADVIELILRHILCRDKTVMRDFLNLRVLPALCKLHEAAEIEPVGYGKLKNNLKYDGMYYDIQNPPETIISIIEKNSNKMNKIDFY